MRRPGEPISITPGENGLDTRDIPAGDERREQLARNADALAEQAADDPRERIDPAKLDRIAEDRDIRQRYEPGGWGNPYNRLRIQHAKSGFVYCLVCVRGESTQVDSKRAEMVPDAEGYAVPVWELVVGNGPGEVYPETPMDEAPNWRDSQGFRRVGDTILMRARKDRYRLWQEEMERVNQLKADAGTRDLEALGERYRRAGHVAAVRINSPLSDPRIRREAQRAAARGIAREQFDTMLREGRLPGAEIGR